MSLKTIARSAAKVILFAVGVTVLIASLGTTSTNAQQALDRKVKSKVSPAYPEIARKMGLAGSVKLEITVAPNGTVKETKVIGGNPILVNAAVDAVKKWRFEPASDENVGVVEFKFDPTN